MSDTWNLTKQNRAGDPSLYVLTIELRHETRNIAAIIAVEFTARACTRLRVTFNAPKIWHAQAEAARLYAELLDTIGDLCDSDPLVINPRLEMTSVELSGADAVFPIATYFGDAVSGVLL